LESRATDNVGTLLRGIKREEVGRGMVCPQLDVMHITTTAMAVATLIWAKDYFSAIGPVSVVFFIPHFH
jgi:translation elongation factor EF-Tu-like GTPase